MFIFQLSLSFSLSFLSYFPKYYLSVSLSLSLCILFPRSLFISPSSRFKISPSPSFLFFFPPSSPYLISSFHTNPPSITTINQNVLKPQYTPPFTPYPQPWQCFEYPSMINELDGVPHQARILWSKKKGSRKGKIKRFSRCHSFAGPNLIEWNNLVSGS